MDVGGGRRRIERRQADLPDCHLVKDNASIPHYTIHNRTEAFYIDRTFDFNCQKMSTSWYFRITFARLSYHTVSCKTSICRTDGGAASVDVQLVVTIRMEHRPFDDICVKHLISGMASGQAEAKVLGTVLEGGDARRLGDKELPFEFCLTVQGCHNEKKMTGSYMWRKKNKSYDDSEGSPSSKRILLRSCL